MGSAYERLTVASQISISHVITEDKYNITDPMYTFPVNATGKLEGIVIYSGDADFEGIFHGMMVDIKAAEEPTETYTITVNASALDASESVGGWKNVKSADCTEDKRFKVVFSSAAYSQVRIMLPDMQDIFGNGGQDQVRGLCKRHIQCERTDRSGQF